MERNVMGELNVYRGSGAKPNFSEIARRHGMVCLVKPRFRKRALLSFGFRHESFSGSGAGTPLYS